MSRRRVAVTGVGLVTALGASTKQSWTAMLEGRCGIGPLRLFDSAGYRSTVAAEVDLDAVAQRFTKLERRRWSRSDQIGIAAAQQALDDSGLLDSGVRRHQVGVLLGAGTADLLRNEEYFFTLVSSGINRARPSDVFHHFLSTPVDLIANYFGLQGPRSCLVAACASSTIAIGRAADMIRSGRVEAALAGGTDALSRVTYSGFNALRLMDLQPCRPFDRSREGMSIGEGAGILVLEDMERARRRSAPIYGELAGYSLRCEAFHPTAPEPDGVAVAAIIRDALADAGLSADAVDHVNAHGTATPQNDRAEARGCLAVFGDRSRRMPATSIKSMVGHCLGAAGGVEAAALALTVAHGVIPPTVNHEETDPDCPIEVVANDAREQRVQCGVSVSLGFGGNDSALVMQAI
jgi:3-oxoacyl-[acyl-carrier-protein] synthase II